MKNKDSKIISENNISKIILMNEISNNLNELEGILAYKSIDHEIIHCNEKFLKYTGHKNIKEIAGKTDYDLIWQEYTDIYHNQEDDTLYGEYYSALHPGKDVDGRDFLFFNRKYPWIGSDKKTKGIISYSIEIKDSRFVEIGNLLKRTAIYNPKGIHYIKKTRLSYNLSKREVECLFYLVRGKSMKTVAKILGLSPRTIETYLARLKEKINCYNKSDLIEFAIKEGFADMMPEHLSPLNLTNSLKEQE